MVRRAMDTDDDVLRNWRVFDVTAAEPASSDDTDATQTDRQTERPTDGLPAGRGEERAVRMA